VSGGVYPLPNHFQPSIEVECVIAREHGNVLRESLRYDLAVKWIGVVRRQAKQTKRVLGCVGQDPNPKFLDSLPRCTLGELEFSS